MRARGPGLETATRQVIGGAMIWLATACSAAGGVPADAGGGGVAVEASAAAPLPQRVDASQADQASPEAVAAPEDAAALQSGPTDVLVSTTLAGPGDSHTSPSLVAGGVGQDVLVVFDATDEDLTVHAVGWSRSTDDGASFTNEGPFPDPTPGGVTDNYGYPCVARDAVIGNVYVAALGSGPQIPNAIAFFVSANAGVTFNPAVNAADPNLSSSDYIDLPTIAVDNAPGYTQGTVYVAYADFVNGGSSSVKLRLSTYTNHAFAVTEVVSPALGSGDEASLPSVAVAPTHNLFIAYYSQVSGSPGVAVIESSDQGEHFDPSVPVASLHMPITPGSFNGSLGLLGVGPDAGVASVNAYSSPQMAADPVSGALYIVYVDATQDDKANIYFTQSNDQGQSWSTPLRVNDDTTTNDQFLPALAVSLDGTRLAVDFYDRRDDAANLEANRYGATAAISGPTVTFSPNFRLSPTPFPVLVDSDPYLAPHYFAIRTSMVADSTYFYDAYADTRDGHLDVRLTRYGVQY